MIPFTQLANSFSSAEELEEANDDFCEEYFYSELMMV
jgi:hypothetical protein